MVINFGRVYLGLRIIEIRRVFVKISEFDIKDWCLIRFILLKVFKVFLRIVFFFLKG